MKSTGQVRFMKSLLDGGKIFDMADKKLLAPVPVADDYSVSTDLWSSLENEIKIISGRIEAGDELVPEDVVNVRRLKTEVDRYVADFNKAMKADMLKYRKMVDKMLTELGYDNIEQFIAKKKQEQSNIQNARISAKMTTLSNAIEEMLARTEKLKDMPMAKELLPAFTARFPKVQSGAKNNDITDWMPYYAVISRVVVTIDTFFKDPKYADAALLPIHAGTMRELLGYAKDGNVEHIINVPVKFEEDQYLIRQEKLKQSMKSKADAIARIRKILEDVGDEDNLSDAAKQVRTEQTWEEISLIVRLLNNP